VSSEFGVSCLENSEKSSEKVIGGWVDSEGYRGVQRYPVWYVSGIGQAQKRGQDTARLARGTLCWKTVWPAWMPVTAQPAALFVFDPSVTTTRVSRPCRVLIQIRCSATKDFRAFLPHACGSIFSLPRNGGEESWKWWGVFWEWKGSALSVLESTVAAIRVRGEETSFVLGLGKGMCLGGRIPLRKVMSLGR